MASCNGETARFCTKQGSGAFLHFFHVVRLILHFFVCYCNGKIAKFCEKQRFFHNSAYAVFSVTEKCGQASFFHGFKGKDERSNCNGKIEVEMGGNERKKEFVEGCNGKISLGLPRNGWNLLFTNCGKL